LLESNSLSNKRNNVIFLQITKRIIGTKTELSVLIVFFVERGAVSIRVTVKNNKMITKIIRKKKKLWPYFQIIYILPMVITDGNKGDYL